MVSQQSQGTGLLLCNSQYCGDDHLLIADEQFVYSLCTVCVKHRDATSESDKGLGRCLLVSCIAMVSGNCNCHFGCC
jgi:hypothetical protein